MLIARAHDPEQLQTLRIRSCAKNLGHERSFPHHSSRDGRRRRRNRAAARAHLRTRALRQDRLPHPRGRAACAGTVVHGAHRHAAGRLGAAHAGADRRDAGAAARAAHGRAAVPRARHRPRLDRARPRRCARAGTQVGRAGRGRAVLRPRRIQACAEGHRRDAGPGRPGSAAGRRARPRRVRRRVGDDPAGVGVGWIARTETHRPSRKARLRRRASLPLNPPYAIALKPPAGRTACRRGSWCGACGGFRAGCSRRRPGD